MPLPLIPAGVLAAVKAAPLIGAGVNAAISGLQNIGQRAYERKMYNRQRKDALADWNMQNTYNSPEQQMQRLKEAGLNPNLVYGTGSVVANSQSMPRATDMKVGQPQPIEVNPNNILQQYAQTKNTEQNTDNLKKQNQLLDEQIKFYSANTLNKLKDTDVKVFNLAKGESLLKYDLQAADSNVRRMDAQTNKLYWDVAMSMDENKRRWLMSQPTIDKTLQQIQLMKAQQSKIPYEKRSLELQADHLQQRISRYFTNESQKYETNKMLQESILMRNLLSGKQITQVEVETERTRMRNAFLSMGMSETQTSDLISDIFGTFGKK